MSIITKQGRAPLFAAALAGMFVWSSFAQDAASGLKFVATGPTWRVEAPDKTISGDVAIPATYEGKSVSAVANFSNCPGITGVAIPNSVTSINRDAFKNNTGITSVDIPASVATIDIGAFANCNNLSSVTFHGVAKILSQYSASFPGDLDKVYKDGGPGTYTRRPGGSNWMRQ